MFFDLSVLLKMLLVLVSVVVWLIVLVSEGVLLIWFCLKILCVILVSLVVGIEWLFEFWVYMMCVRVGLNLVSMFL